MSSIKMQYIYTMDCYSDVKKNEIMTLTVKLMKLDATILREVIQTQKNNVCFFLIYADVSFEALDTCVSSRIFRG